jgi:hypothetical protein
LAAFGWDGGKKKEGSLPSPKPLSLTCCHLHAPPGSTHTEAPIKTYIGAGMRMCIGGRYEDWLGSSAGGIAFVSSFGDASYGAGSGTTNEVAPAFVFAISQSNHSSTIWKSVNHELGHTLGLL